MSITSRPGDAWLASYPKSGNTWTRILLTNYLHDYGVPVGINDIDTETPAGSREWIDGVLGIKSSHLAPNVVRRLRADAFRRVHRSAVKLNLIKIHDAFRDSHGEVVPPPDAAFAAVYIVRDPRDVACSFAHHFGMPIEPAVDVVNDPQYAHGHAWARGQFEQHLGSWSHHVASWLDQRDVPVCLVRYEDLVSDTAATFARMLEHLGIGVDAARLDRAVGHSEFRSLQKQEDELGFRERFSGSAERFFRKGRIGSWRNELPESLARRIELCHSEVMIRLGYLDEKPDLSAAVRYTMGGKHVRVTEGPVEADHLGGVGWSATNDRAWIRYPGVATFGASATELIIDPEPGANPLTVHDIALQTPLAAVELLRGSHLLDAAVVAGPDGAIALCGVAGAGKTGIAAELVRRHGWAMVADGPVAVDVVDDIPIARPGARLSRSWPGARTVDARAAWSDEPVPLRTLVWLVTKNRGDSVRTEDLYGFKRLETVGLARYPMPAVRMSRETMAFWRDFGSRIVVISLDWIPGEKDLQRVVRELCAVVVSRTD